MIISKKQHRFVIAIYKSETIKVILRETFFFIEGLPESYNGYLCYKNELDKVINAVAWLERK